ncbi:MAG: hypothetical protein ACOYVF_02010 [Candidatus Zixiibacteriota bacterium]
MADIEQYLKVLKPGIIILTAVGLMAITGCNETKIESQWTQTPIRIDGKIDDWKDYAITYYEEENAAVALGNDAQNLYLHFRTNDQEVAQLVKMSGLKIYLDPNGKKKKDFYICYKAGPAGFNMKGSDWHHQNMPPGDRDRDNMSPPDNAAGDQRGRIRDDSTRNFTCYQKNIIIEKPIPRSGDEGPAAAYDTSMGFYAYEFLIPLAKSQVRQYGLGAAPGQPICIGVEWGDMSDMKSAMKSGGGMNGGPPGGGMGGGPPGRMGGNPPGGGPGGQNIPQKQELWIKTILAQPVEANAGAGE